MFVAFALAAAFATTPPLTAEQQELLSKWEQAMRAVQRAYDQGDTAAERKAAEEAVAVIRRLCPKGKEAGCEEAVASTLTELAEVAYRQQKLAEAEPLFREAIGLYRAASPKGDHPDLALSLNNLSQVVWIQGRIDEAEVFSRESLEVSRRAFAGRDDEVLASALNSYGLVVKTRGKLAEAEELYRESLAMGRRLVGDRDDAAVANGMINLGRLLRDQGKLAEAEQLLREALSTFLRLYPKKDHPLTGYAAYNLGLVNADRGHLPEAEARQREALALRRRLYPKLAHPDVAASLNALGTLLVEMGRTAEAEPLLREAVEMNRRVFGEKPHPYAASTLMNLGQVLIKMKKLREAEAEIAKSVELMQRFHGDRDHPDVANHLNSLAVVLEMNGKLDEAADALGSAVAMLRRLYPKRGHPMLANVLLNLGHLRRNRGDWRAAGEAAAEGVEMSRRLYGAGDHPEVARGLQELAEVRLAFGRTDEAVALAGEGVGTLRRLTADSARWLSEGDALNLAGTLPRARDTYLSAALAGKVTAAAIHRELWAAKGAISRVYEQRQLQARTAAADPAVACLLAEQSAARVRRAELLLAPATVDPTTGTKREEELKAVEARLAAVSEKLRLLFPPVARTERLAVATAADLLKTLPATAAVVDFLAWEQVSIDPAKPASKGRVLERKYLAFVVTKGEVKLVDLGPAEAIEKAVGLWREAITNPQHSVPADLGAEVRKLVWEKVRKELPKGVKEVFISPDAALCRLPWVALPGDKPGTVLLEDEFAVATIPHAPFLLDHLWEKDKSIKEKAEVLVVGGVDFDAKLGAKIDPKAKTVELLRAANAKPWPTLPASETEAAALAKFADGQKWANTILSGDKATAAAVLAALPKAKHAHLATHGFFADAKFRSVFQLDEKDYKIGFGGERVGRAANSPLVMTGLVLAGANDPATPGRGVVTGESLIDLDLSGMELAVLSACDTGLGDVAGGEGTFGLQRAFHLAGTRNVVAGLWSVPDAETAALMGEFYRQLWEKKQSPMQALKAAQLAVYRTDRTKFESLQLRGFKASGVKDTDPKAYPPSSSTDGTVRNHPALWAAFSLSGPGR